MLEIAPITLEEVNQRMIELATTIRQDTDEFYVRFEDAQYDRAFLRARVNTLFRDRRFHRHTTMLLDREATYAHRAWTGSEDRSAAIEAHNVIVEEAEMAMTTMIQGTGVVGLTQWLEKMESVFHISNCTVACQVKFSTCTLQGNALTWWNSHVRAVGYDVAYAMPGKTLKKMMTDKYYPRSEIKKLETKMIFSEESDVVEKYVGGLPDMIHGSVKASKPKTMKEEIEFATELMDKKILTLAERPGVKKLSEDLFFVAQCNLVIYMIGSVLPSALIVKGLAIWPGHFKSDCPKLKNGNQGNRAGNGNVVARAYAVGIARTNPNSNVVTGTFLLNNRHASILFDTGADRSFVSTAFSSLIDIIPTTLDHGYDVELADEMGSFDVIIGMEWLSKYYAVIVCDEKLVRVPFGNEILTFHGDGSNNGHESRLNIISCTKTQKYLLKGCPIFLAHVTTKKVEDKSKEKRPNDVPIV
ncbi:putative reverse transcriptase domain-containing protein [Tanacetum coccineum]